MNGTAVLTLDSAMTEAFDKNGKRPKTVMVATVDEMYFQCAKALMRSRLWTSGDESERFPTAGQFTREVKQDFDAQSYDAGYPAYAQPRMWHGTFRTCSDSERANRMGGYSLMSLATRKPMILVRSFQSCPSR